MYARLVDLAPKWISHAGRSGQGVTFRCPCGDASCERRPGVYFANPLDGRPSSLEGPKWTREGDTFEAMTLAPSVNVDGGHWHGFIRNGEVISC